MEHAIVVVLGDIGHSPRTCFHALSIAKRKIPVELVGYLDSKPHRKIISNPLITIVPIKPPPNIFNKLPVISLFLKLIWLCTVLPYTLLFKTSFYTSIILIQNPPGIPTMFFTWMISKIKRGKLIIDWHNYTCSMIRYKYQLDKPDRSSNILTLFLSIIADLVSFYEGIFGRIAKWNICVSNSMRQDLRERWNVKAVTHYDRPQSWNKLCYNDEKKHDFYYYLREHPDFERYLSKEPYSIFKFDCGEVLESTLFSYRNTDNSCHLRVNRPLLLISSTSWTEDEDFSILLESLKKYDSANTIRSRKEIPDLFVVITGKGPMKEYYLKEINQRKWNHVIIVTPWLAAEDYPRMLACADIGVSLHASTSGLDLPMKVVDMLGCRVPILAKNFPAIPELVNLRNGRTFENSNELFHHLVDLATGFPEKSSGLQALKQQIIDDGQIDWDCQWDASVWPLLQDIALNTVDEIQRRQRYGELNDSD